MAKEYLEKKQIPSERELCEIYNVSRTTIRKAIDELVKEGLLIKRPGKGNFVKEISSFTQKKGLKKGPEKDTGNILFIRCTHHSPAEIVSSIRDDIFYPKIMAGIDLGVTKRKYHCLVRNIYEYDDPQRIEDELGELVQKVDGIICGELHSQEFLQKLLAIQIPLVLVSPSVITNETDIVDIDNFTGGYRATDYLVNLGHREIAFIGGPSSSLPAQKRKNGYLEALKKAKIPIHQERILSCNWQYEAGYKAMIELLKLNPRPTAVVAGSDLLAIGAMNAIKDAGLKIPDDLAIIGFDGIDMAGEIQPSLTTMHVRKFQMGEIAADLIFEQLQGDRDYPVRVAVPTVLIERSSSKVNPV